MNPNTFGKLSSYNGEVDCAGGRTIHVPIKFTAPIAAAGARVYADQIDLTTFLLGNPAPYVEGIQTLVVYQNSKDTSGNLSANSFLTEFRFNNGFKCMAPGRAFTAISVIADNLPIIDFSVFTIGALAATFAVELDFYFTNFEVDQVKIGIE